GGRSATLVNITSSSPMEIVCLDYLSLERSKGGEEHILVITDHFSRYAQAIPTRNQTARTTARVLFDNFVVHYGFPARIHSDQGQNFESKLIKELCQIARVEKSRTTPYHPMGNGQVERFNQTLLQMLGTLEVYEKSDWKAHVPSLVHAYNATFHDSTGYSPYFLMFGRHPRLALDAFLGLTPDALSSSSKTEYVRKLQERLNFAYKKATEEAKRKASIHKKHYDASARNSVLTPGDLVLVKNVGIRGKHKIADRWEHDPYVVISQPNDDIPVYEIQRQNTRSRKTKLLHRTLLLPFMGLPRIEEEEEEEEEEEPVQPDDQLSQSGFEADDQSLHLHLSDCTDSFSEASEGVASSIYSADESSVDSSQSEIGTYRIPMRRNPGDSGPLPRSPNLPPTRAQQVRTSFSASSISGEEEAVAKKASTRRRQKPSWMRGDDWLLGQVYTFTVEPDQIVNI
ncbi:MAG: DDE-type integrase/transposase/recombinase, partial [Candidatus Thiodiazotropha taylori]|nr:DDE-type integrase/transposase/recombinase [Candidatus Thiodiazotropha taylori]MCW4308941.1 DDE-type integrase/transposase/recombinase [Candidatus Thiodiazotropha endolucinida]